MQLQPKDILPYIYKAVRNREHHQQQQLNCGTACCVAGDIVINHFPELTPYLVDNGMGEEFFTNIPISDKAMNAWKKPWDYSENTFQLNSELAVLIFHSRATVYSHLLAIFLIENGLGDDLDVYYWDLDDYCYNTLEFPFCLLEIDGVGYSNNSEIHDLLDKLLTEENSISSELQALLTEVKESVPV